jgi:hypothetical protein
MRPRTDILELSDLNVMRGIEVGMARIVLAHGPAVICWRSIGGPTRDRLAGR